MTKLIVKKPSMNPFGFNFPTLFPTDIFHELDRTFSELLDMDFTQSGRNLSLRKGFPKGDIFLNKDGQVVIELALAGYKKEQLSVKIENNKLVVSGEKCEEDENTNSRSLARRAFTKEFPNFTNEWDLQAAAVSYKDGLLQIVVPKLAQEIKAVTKLEIK